MAGSAVHISLGAIYIVPLPGGGSPTLVYIMGRVHYIIGSLHYIDAKTGYGYAPAGNRSGKAVYIDALKDYMDG